MNEQSADRPAHALTTEEAVGRLLRLLRQGRGWSQKEAADRMRPYGYKWNQSTITRIESASRPLRVNELADLALLYGVPLSQFLEPSLLLGEGDHLEDVKKEIGKFEAKRSNLLAERTASQEALEAAHARSADLTAMIAHVDAALRTLRSWYPEESAEGRPG